MGSHITDADISRHLWPKLPLLLLLKVHLKKHIYTTSTNCKLGVGVRGRLNVQMLQPYCVWLTMIPWPRRFPWISIKPSLSWPIPLSSWKMGCFGNTKLPVRFPSNCISMAPANHNWITLSYMKHTFYTFYIYHVSITERLKTKFVHDRKMNKTQYQFLNINVIQTQVGLSLMCLLNVTNNW